MKSFLKKFIPEWVLGIYHYLLSITASIVYGFPSSKMIVIGVVGTKGKTTTANMTWSVLTAGGMKTGILTTANVRIGKDEFKNSWHMTMPGRFTIQKYLSKMNEEKCKAVIIETTSEGIKQWRHKGINYDILIFTNLSPEHLPSHGGSYDKYRTTKGRIFKSLSKQKHKIFDCKRVDKVIIANNDDEEKNYFLSFPADKKVTFGMTSSASLFSSSISLKGFSSTFKVGNSEFLLNLPGVFNITNSLPAIAVGRCLGINDSKIKEGLSSLSNIPGRMEKIKTKHPFTVIVDYAHEGKSMKLALEASRQIAPNRKVIVLLGAEGGGRDKAKRPIMGEVSAKIADYVIVSNVDPYDDDPTEIIEDIAKSAEKFGKVRGKNLFTIESRRKGIEKALSLAKRGDVVIITGKGAEQSMIVGGKSYPWDDRNVVTEELQKLFLH